MLSAYGSSRQSAGPVRPVKQGWIGKRGTGLISRFRVKDVYVVLHGEPHPILYIYERRDQTGPAKHEITLPEASIELPDDADSSRKKYYQFCLRTRERNFNFAAPTVRERDDWIHLLKQYLHGPIVHRGLKSKSRIDPLRGKSDGSAHHDSSRPQSSGIFHSQSQPNIKAPSQNPFQRFSTLSRPSLYKERDDTVSTYSRDDRSLYSAALGSTAYDEETDIRSINSTFETLSLFSEPVLTPQDLAQMGSITVQKEESPLRKRKDPYHLDSQNALPENWNDKYQRLLSLFPDDTESRLKLDLQIVEMVGNFQETAKTHACRIIDEYHTRSRTSTEYIHGPRGELTVYHEGVVYQFACNYDEASPEEIDEALCRTSAELRGINAVNQSRARISTALMTIVDYKGFRIVAFADMGLDERVTLVHSIGSRCPKIDERVAEPLSAVARFANLKTHVVNVDDERRISVHGSASMEAHADKTGRHLYAVNLHELFPMDFGDSAEGSVGPKGGSLAPSSVSNGELNTAVARPDSKKRFRPEFVKAYQAELASDALTEKSGSGRREREVNDGEALRAAKYLRENWVPAFVRKLDELEVRPIDSHMLVTEMHRYGVNVRYLGMIARISTLPCIREMATIEMAARASKALFQSRVRSAIAHFRSVGATQIDEEMKGYVATMFQLLLGVGDKTRKFFDEKLRNEIEHKFEYDMDFHEYTVLHRPALFLAMQYHCGVQFEDSLDYDFDNISCIARHRLVSFAPRAKSVNGLPQTSETNPNFTEDERMAYFLARHFKAIGSLKRLGKSDASALALIQVATHYLKTGRFEEAKLYASSATSAASKNSALWGLSQGVLIEAMSRVQSNPSSGPDTQILSVYSKALANVQWHWGKVHPITMALHDRMATCYMTAKKYQQAYEFHCISMEIALKSLGKHHSVTAGYLTVSGVYLNHLKQTEDATKKLNEALHIYLGLRSDATLVSEVRHHLAECLAAQGDLDGAIENSRKSKKLREKCFGQLDARSVESYRQLSRLVLQPYQNYKGVVTPQIRQAYRDAISCHEKTFRYLKTLRPPGGSGGSSSASDTISLRSGKASMVSLPSTIASYTAASHSVTDDSMNGCDTLFGPKASLLFGGPLVAAPFAPLTPLPKNLLHVLIRQIVALKLKLVENPHHKEVVRNLRMNPHAVETGEARGVILQLAAVSPSVYLDGVFQRIDDDDECAVQELAIVLALTEKETVGLA
ncbi:clustered mitochondria-domain-containing protein [Polychytrium aggregatum]|uniref:clustered mitochondria-domain-containing protein n=1 Tax=Polychytrium aggregatum TaxID=110093 RepID=UPI0022FEC644|nr:clustered mitochondria-domain-containing protein [Polychytrium aggregatum]KAI9205234.1 clustered mitochondria-domain-containing protein [Polychytrium aggregatum]